MNKPHREDRAWVRGWGPEQTANRTKLDFPDGGSMRISREAVYQALRIEGRGALKRELVWRLRAGRALRAPRERSCREAWAHAAPETLISERPASAEDRAVAGRWEGDLSIGLERFAIGAVAEPMTRSTILARLPREPGRRHKKTPKNGPALAGYGAATTKNAPAESTSAIPEQLRRSLAWDRAKEPSAHAQSTIETDIARAQSTIETDIAVFFADPQPPWQRGTNENTNGLLRQHFPKGTDPSRWPAEETEAAAHALNTRPRKTLGCKTPAEALDEHPHSLQQPSAATTG